MAKSLARAKEQMAAIERFNASRGGFADARAKFNATQAAVTQAAAAMKRGAGDARTLARNYDRAQAAVTSASRAFEQQKTAVLSAKRSLEGFGIPISELAAEQNRLRSAVESANAALDRQHLRSARLAKVAGAIGRATANVGMIAGPGILHATKEGVKAGAEIQHEIVKMRAAGVPEQDINRALDQTAEFQPKYTNVKRATALERYKELRSVLVHPEEAHELLETTVRANSAMNAVDRSGHLSEGLGFGIKGAEILGRAQDPKRFEQYINAFIKAQQVMGKTITPEQQFEMAKYFGASGATLSDRFVNTTGISLAQEMQSRAAVGTDQLIKQVVGGFQGSQHSAAKEFVKLGLADKGDFDKTKTGEIKGLKPGRHVKNWRKAMTDPDRYIYEDVIPALEKAGITKQEDQIAYGRRLFTSGRAADVFAKLVQQRPSFENHAKLYEKAQGLDAGDTNAKDPFVALNSLSTSLTNFAATVTSPVMENAASALSGMASSVGAWAQTFAEFQKNNPTLAKAAGAGAIATAGGAGIAGTYGLVSALMNGFGLKSSALALDGSAAALTAAAAKLSGGGLPGIPEGKAPKLPGTKMPFLPVLTAVTAPLLLGGDTPESQSDLMDKKVADQTAAWRRGRDFTLGSNKTFGANFGTNSSFERFPQSPFPGGTIGGPGLSYREAPVQRIEASGQVTGETTITVKLEAGTELVRAVAEAKAAKVAMHGTISTNGPGSVGKSSPDAAAPSSGANGNW